MTLRGEEQASAFDAAISNSPARMVDAAASLLSVRTRTGQSLPLRANAAQRLFEERCGRENIVLKARQMGMTTWIAARFLLKTATQPGTLTLHVAHTQDAAAGILAIVRRFVEGMDGR